MEDLSVNSLLEQKRAREEKEHFSRLMSKTNEILDLLSDFTYTESLMILEAGKRTLLESGNNYIADIKTKDLKTKYDDSEGKSTTTKN